MKNKHAPLTSEEQLNDVLTKRNALNKQRSKAMERRIASTLRGRRVPMSGAAAQYKGDVEIPFYNYPGKYIIECKMSAQRHRDLEPEIRLEFAWLPKLHKEAEYMAAKFGILIIHFHGVNNDYVFIRKDIAQMLLTRYRSEYADIIMHMLSLTPLIDVRYNLQNKPRAAFNMQRKHIENIMMDISGMKGMRMILPDDEYLVVHLDTYKALTRHL